ncbi:MAG: bifunctional phosphoglucose/phosphomannose isomerase [Acidimicrobiia bacterium]|nr:bifunctional phosphoglucose/phosphomannose isomerase [Acidimicrobiia bacterium]
MLAQIRSLGDQLEWAAALDAPGIGTYSEVLCVGMGGSGIAGDYAAALAVPFGTRLTVHKAYGPLPPWAVRVRPFVIASSYSGNTEETLDFVLAAQEHGLPIATVTTGGRLGELTERYRWPTIQVPGGMQPRAAIGYMFGAVIRLLEGAHAIDDQRLSFVEAISLARQSVAEDGPRWSQAEDIAEGLKDRISIIYGGGPVSSAVAQRWKTQINENSKMPAWWSVLPELDHNEVAGWEAMPEKTKESLAIVGLTDRDDHDRIGPRLAHTAALTEDAVPWVARVQSTGTSVLARLVSLTVTGDLVSWMLAGKAGVDPVPVVRIERLKKLLSED